MAEIDRLTKELRKYLYSKDTEINEIDKISLQKSLFSLLRECIKQKEYEVEIGSYRINLSPEQIMVEYENEETSIRISETDVYYETSRETEIRYFIVGPSENTEEFPASSPVIRVTGLVTNIDGDCEERYNIELFNIDENIMDYINIPSNMKLSPYTEPTKYAIILIKPVSVHEKRVDASTFFKQEKIIPVTYDIKKDKYIRSPLVKEYNPVDYTSLLPTLENRKNIVSFIYSPIVEFYTEYITNNY